jgi:hypothetical protein
MQDQPNTIERMLGEQTDDVTHRITIKARNLYWQYSQAIPIEDIEQQMWLTLMENLDDADFLTQTPAYITQLLYWRAKDWIATQLSYLNHVTAEDAWEFAIDHIEDPIADLDDELSFDQEWGFVISKMLEDVAGTTAEQVARSLMEGHTKAQTARAIDKAPSTITLNVKVIRAALERHRLSQAGAC